MTATVPSGRGLRQALKTLQRLKAGGEGNDRGWDVWMASPTLWTSMASPTPGVWVNSGRWWWTGKPGMLQCVGLQRVGHNWATELNWGGEGDEWRWDGLMASLTQWTWVWASFGSLWWTEKPGVLQSVGSQIQTWVIYWTELISISDPVLTTWKSSCQFQFYKTVFCHYTYFIDNINIKPPPPLLKQGRNMSSPWIITLKRNNLNGLILK